VLAIGVGFQTRETDMTRIVAGVDGSAHADRALRWAVQEAQAHGAELELMLAYSSRFPGLTSTARGLAPGSVTSRRSALVDANQAIAEQTLDGVVTRHRGLLDQVKWTTTLTPVLASSAAQALIEAGDEADLVVVGSRGLGGFGTLLLGSTSYRTAGHAPCPVAVVPDVETPITAPRRIVVGIDASRGARRALRWAVEEAVLRDVPLTVAHGYHLPTMMLLGGVQSHGPLDQMRADARHDAEHVVARALEIVDIPPDVQVDRIIMMGSAAGLLLDLADGDTLVVVGTRGHGAIGRMVLGSVSHQVLHHATCPVVVAP
jgi:nucleotide-binding universal stress UspA family protein